MKKILLLAALIFLYFNEISFSEAFPYAGDLTGGIVSSDKKHDAYADLLLPVAGNGESFVFVSPRMSMTGEEFFKSDANEFNIGIGYRKYFEKFFKDGAVAGVNLYYDVRNTASGHNFQQAGAGIEFLSSDFDFRLNGYIPFSNKEYFMGKFYDFPTQHHIAATYYYETAMSGGDGEVGFKLPLPYQFGELRVFGGYYYFDADKADTVKGFKCRAEYSPINIFKINYALYENKDFSGCRWQAGADIKIPFDLRNFLRGSTPFKNFWKYIKTRPRSVRHRMGESVQRDMYIRTQKKGVVHNDDRLSKPPTEEKEGYEYYFTVVKPGGTGNGTFENPANLEDGLSLNKNVSGENAVLLLSGGNYSLTSTLNLSGHQAKDIYVIGQQEVDNMGGDISKISTGNPIIEVSSGVTALTLSSSLNNNFMISSIEFIGKNNSGTGIDISDYEQELIVRNNSFTGFFSGAKVDNSSSAVRFINNIFDENVVGAQVSGKAASFESNVFTNNGDTALLLSDADGALAAMNLIENIDEAVGISIIGGKNSLLYGNAISSGTYGIYLLNSTATASVNNQITYFKKSAIRVLNDDGSRFDGNYISEGKGEGINITNSSGTMVLSNTIEENDSIGIYVCEGRGLIFGNNTISSNTGEGIYAENISDSNILQNFISSSSLNGISIKGISSSYITGNVLSSQKLSGIHIVNASSVTVSSNTANYNMETGIIITSGTDITILNNNAYCNKIGMEITKISSCSILSNDCSTSTVWGMYIVDISSAQMHYNNADYNTGSGGMYIEKVYDSLIEGNKTTENENVGMKIINSSNTIVSYNGFQNNNKKAHGLILNNAENITFYWNAFTDYPGISSSGEDSSYGLYLETNVSFVEQTSGENKFFKSDYGGNEASVLEYETKVRDKDMFY